MPKLTNKYKEVTPEEAWDITECMPVKLFFLPSDDGDYLFHSDRQHGTRHAKDKWVDINRGTRYFVKVDGL
jgi:hypothetical protein